MTPAQPGGFRIHSQRPVLGEWRDGTQLYFSAAYAQPWWTRMNALQPGMRIAPDGKRLRVQERSLSHLDNQQVIALAKQYGAQYVVLAAEPARRLRKLHGDSEWTVDRPEIVPPSMVESGAMAEPARRLLTKIPAGRLPVTFSSSLKQQPPLDDYAVDRGRTYMYFAGTPLYPFGHGLSYTRFEYGNLRLDRVRGRCSHSGTMESPAPFRQENLPVRCDRRTYMV